tara:strand:- start:35 stop:505 length:471 start_codon:yes stop_codon:yes gene_type:complete
MENAVPELPPANWRTVDAVVVKGHQVASGQNGDPRFPDGTLRMQVPFFEQHGIDLRHWHLATINLSIAPAVYSIHQPRLTIDSLQWHPTEAAEDFSFFDCLLNGVAGLIYFPHPDTKPEHEQPDDVLEILLPVEMNDVKYGARMTLSVDPKQMQLG